MLISFKKIKSGVVTNRTLRRWKSKIACTVCLWICEWKEIYERRKQQCDETAHQPHRSSALACELYFIKFKRIHKFEAEDLKCKTGLILAHFLCDYVHFNKEKDNLWWTLSSISISKQTNSQTDIQKKHACCCSCLHVSPAQSLTSELSNHVLVLFQGILQDFLCRIHFPAPFSADRVGMMSVSGAKTWINRN